MCVAKIWRYKAIPAAPTNAMSPTVVYIAVMKALQSIQVRLISS